MLRATVAFKYQFLSLVFVSEKLKGPNFLCVESFSHHMLFKHKSTFWSDIFSFIPDLSLRGGSFLQSTTAMKLRGLVFQQIIYCVMFLPRT